MSKWIQVDTWLINIDQAVAIHDDEDKDRLVIYLPAINDVVLKRSETKALKQLISHCFKTLT